MDAESNGGGNSEEGGDGEVAVLCARKVSCRASSLDLRQSRGAKTFAVAIYGRAW